MCIKPPRLHPEALNPIPLLLTLILAVFHVFVMLSFAMLDSGHGVGSVRVASVGAGSEILALARQGALGTAAGEKQGTLRRHPSASGHGIAVRSHSRHNHPDDAEK